MAHGSDWRLRQVCPVDCQWDEPLGHLSLRMCALRWGPWTSCSATCNGGITTRQRHPA